MKVGQNGAFYQKALIQDSDRDLDQAQGPSCTDHCWPSPDMLHDGCKTDTRKDPETSIHSFLCLPREKDPHYH